VNTKVHLYSNLRQYTGGQAVVEVTGNTVGDALADLVRQYPAIQPRLFEKSGALSSQIYASVNMQSRNPEKLETPLKQGDEVYLILIVAGG
jgi:MoaD family protein